MVYDRFFQVIVKPANSLTSVLKKREFTIKFVFFSQNYEIFSKLRFQNPKMFNNRVFYVPRKTSPDNSKNAERKRLKPFFLINVFFFFVLLCFGALGSQIISAQKHTCNRSMYASTIFFFTSIGFYTSIFHSYPRLFHVFPLPDAHHQFVSDYSRLSFRRLT